MVANLEKYLQNVTDKVNDLSSTQNDASIAENRISKNKVQEIGVNYFSKALCVDTLDFRKENRVRFYHPMLHRPDTPVDALPFASPISPFGGIDDCGLNWVPPAGSTLCILFENGDRDSAHYFGTTWSRTRAPIASKEYQKFYEGQREQNYFTAQINDDETFLELPQWNTESYNNYDYTNLKSFTENIDEQVRFTNPNIYGHKTPGKAMLKHVDGDPNCNHRWARTELLSSGGNWMIFKDDHMHFGGQWAFGDSEDVTLCAVDSLDSGGLFTDLEGNPVEENNGCSDTILGGPTNVPENPPEIPGVSNIQQGSNKYFKHKNEQRPYKGPGTAQNNKCDLPQSGIQFLSIAGNTMVFDDSVEQPQGKPGWERSLEDFDYGCTDRYMGRIYIRSAHGHEFAMSDHESSTNVRSEYNYIRLKSALGNRVELNDHSIGNESCEHAGTERGVHIESTSKHKLSLIDDRNDQCGSDRMGGGEPLNQASNAYVRLESGYGSMLEFGDNNSQQETQNQYVRLINPQQANGEDPNKSEFGPHILRMQAHPNRTPGVVYLRAGGYYLRETTHNDINIVGDKELNPEGADKYTYVSKTNSIIADDTQYLYSGTEIVLQAEERIMLLAGRDCSPEAGKKCNGPCLYPVIIARCPITCPVTGIRHFSEYSISERVFASGKQVNCKSGDVQNPTGQGEGCDEGDKKKDDNTVDIGEGEVLAGQGGN